MWTGIQLAQDRNQWWNLVERAINLQIPKKNVIPFKVTKNDAQNKLCT
jgi:hypothetical protein